MGEPGYYWLAYEWSNLFFSCQLCNQRYKGNLFPLEDPADRALSHHDDLTAEAPLFIDLANEDPTEYVGFREEYAYAIDDNEYGVTCIKALGLNRAELEERRRDRLSELKYKVRMVDILAQWENDAADPLDSVEQGLLDDLRVELAENTTAAAEYSAMASAALASVAASHAAVRLGRARPSP